VIEASVEKTAPCASIAWCAPWIAPHRQSGHRQGANGGASFSVSPPLSKRKSRSKTAACNKPISHDYQMLRMFESPQIEVHIVRASKIQRASANQRSSRRACAHERDFCRDRQAHPAFCRFARAISLGEARPNHDRKKANHRRSFYLWLSRFAAFPCSPSPRCPLARTPKSDANASREAFLQIYKVFTSPRCQNCHPAGDSPLQGDDSHVHLQIVKRGKDGHGVYGMRATPATSPRICPGATCRREIRRVAPRARNQWFSLPHADRLCRQLKIPSRPAAARSRIARTCFLDDLVGWGWTPTRRALPPLSRADTIAQMKIWMTAEQPAHNSHPVVHSGLSGDAGPRPSCPFARYISKHRTAVPPGHPVVPRYD